LNKKAAEKNSWQANSAPGTTSKGRTSSATFKTGLTGGEFELRGFGFGSLKLFGLKHEATALIKVYAAASG